MARRCAFGFFCRRAVLGACSECEKPYCEKHGVLHEKRCCSCQAIVEQMEARLSLNPMWVAKEHSRSRNRRGLCGYLDCPNEPVKECAVCGRDFCDDHLYHTWYSIWGDPTMPTRTGDPPVITMRGDVCPDCQNWKDIEVRYELTYEMLKIKNEYESRIKK
jgi:hypothetical protein